MILYPAGKVRSASPQLSLEIVDSGLNRPTTSTARDGLVRARDDTPRVSFNGHKASFVEVISKIADDDPIS